MMEIINDFLGKMKVEVCTFEFDTGIETGSKELPTTPMNGKIKIAVV